MKKKLFGYILYCDGCCTDIRYGHFNNPCGVIENKISDPVYSTKLKAIAAGMLANGSYPAYTYRVFTYEAK